MRFSWLWRRGDVGLETLEQLDILRVALSKVCGDDTTACKEHWTKEDFTHGHCAVFALLVQKLCGGKMLRADLSKLPRYAHMRSHYWNLLPNGAEVDLSADQFRVIDRDLVPVGKTDKNGEPITRKGLLAYEPTRKRYELLEKRLNELFDRVDKKAG